MINNIAFTGRETMLTAGLEKGTQKAAEKAIDVVKASSVLPEIVKAKPQSIYTSPFAPIEIQSTSKSVGAVLNFFG